MRHLCRGLNTPGAMQVLERRRHPRREGWLACRTLMPLLSPLTVTGTMGGSRRQRAIGRQRAVSSVAEVDTSVGLLSPEGGPAATRANLESTSHEQARPDEVGEAADADAFAYSGGIPNVFWRHVPLSALRLSARYIALPPPSAMCLSGRASPRYMQQDSQAWCDAHAGVLTTARLKGLLGFFESKAGGMLGLPRSMQSRGPMRDAVEHMMRQPSETLSATLLDGPRLVSEAEASHAEIDAMIAALHAVKLADRHEADPELTVPVASPAEVLRRSQISRSVASRGPGAVRMAYGTLHEPRALIALLSHFRMAAIEEMGLVMVSPASIPPSWATGLLPPLGASPDGVLVHADGTREVVEIKCACPFLPASKRHGGGRGHGRYHLARSTGGGVLRPASCSFNPVHVAQLQLEMLATGTASALLATLSASGLQILRIPRDDSYLASMLRFVSLVNILYVVPGRLPPAEVLYERPDYRAFLKRTLALSRSATVVADSIPVDAVAGTDPRPFVDGKD